MTFRDMLANSISVGNYPGRTADDVWRVRKAFIAQRKPGTFLQELGNGRLVAISHQPLPDGAWVATYEDITERHLAETQIKFMAQHDVLTKLPNRLLFGEKLELAIASAGRGIPCALVCLDLDGFKLVNDGLGHAAGDRLLCQVAERLKQGSRDGDTVARLGGDEFAMVLPGTGASEAFRLSKRIGDLLRREYDLDQSGIAIIGVSIGIACAPEHAEEADTLMSHADNALYVAKQAGLPTPYVYGEKLPNVAVKPGRTSALGMSVILRDGISAQRDAVSLVRDLRIALQSGALHLEYQPICDLDNAEIVTFEALLRWTQPNRGTISPSEFIPAAEDSGFIVPLSEWVMRTACLEAATWKHSASVGVNLSPLSFRQPDLLTMVASILADTGLPAQRLVIEVTERLLLEQSGAVQSNIMGLRALGIDLWLDDFGTGYANFATLHSAPFASIKISQSFLAVGALGRGIIGPMITFGHSYGLKVVVEGVETMEQIEFLRGYGCKHMQGYIFGRPLRSEQIATQNLREIALVTTAE